MGDSLQGHWHADAVSKLSNTLAWHCKPAMAGWMYMQRSQSALYSFFILCLTVCGVEPVLTHQTSWLESTGVHAGGSAASDVE